jgi:hypothetical protein
MNHVIKEIESTSKNIFSKSTFILEETGYGIYAISGDYLTDAVSNWKNQQSPIKVLKWFDDFWLYLEIKFIKVTNEYKDWKKDKRDEYEFLLTKQCIKFEDDFYQTFVTLSVFQGDDEDKVKAQLFRAEWDSFADNVLHPQPHWHILLSKYDQKTTEDFETYMEMNKEQGFEELMKSDGKKLIDIKRFHFAMCGHWTLNNGKTYIHSIESCVTLNNWITGVLTHIKEQLEYLKCQQNSNIQ